MSETKTIDPADVICGLKAAVEALECHHNMQLLKQKVEQQTPLYMMIPIERITYKDTKQHPHRKKHHIKRVTSSWKSDHCGKRSKLTDLKFPEMRAGVLYSKCMCLHRNGLQDTCPLTQCQGQPKCLAKPWPICPPGKFVRSRYPEQYPMPLQYNTKH